jgi:hypothetical protein
MVVSSLFAGYMELMLQKACKYPDREEEKIRHRGD